MVNPEHMHRILECMIQNRDRLPSQPPYERRRGELTGNEIHKYTKLKNAEVYKLLPLMEKMGLIKSRTTGVYGKGHGRAGYHLATEKGRRHYFHARADGISDAFRSFNEMMHEWNSSDVMRLWLNYLGGGEDELLQESSLGNIKRENGVEVSLIDYDQYEERSSWLRGNFDEFVRNAVRIYQRTFLKGDYAVYVSPAGELFKIHASKLKGVKMQHIRSTVGDKFKYAEKKTKPG